MAGDERTVKASGDGPYLLKGPVVVVDPAGNELHFRAGKSLALCRCGASSTKPLCDGSHSRVGFAASEAAPEASLRRFAPPDAAEDVRTPSDRLAQEEALDTTVVSS